MNKILKNGIRTIFACGYAYFASVTLPQGISMVISPNIENKSQLESILNEERKKLGIKEDVKIEARLDKESFWAGVRKIDEKRYEMVLGKFFSNRSTIRHELYHIFDGHCDQTAKINSELKHLIIYGFIHEPQATMYQATGMKL